MCVPSTGGLATVPAGGYSANELSRILFGSSMWYDVRLGAPYMDEADFNHAQQNLARQYAANFGKHGTKDPLSHHLIQNTESVLVTTTLDLVPPRGDGVDHSGDSVKLEFEPRGFFADQFEVGCFVLFLLICVRRKTGPRFFLWTRFTS